MSIIEIKVPPLAESVADATILEWYKRPGDTIVEGDKLVDIETDKVVLEVVAPKAGMLIEILKSKGENVLSEEIIGQMDTDVATAKPVTQSASPKTVASETPAPSPTPSKAEKKGASTPKTSPAVRKIAADQGLDLNTIPRQGERVTKTDVVQANASKASGVVESPKPAVPPVPPAPAKSTSSTPAEVTSSTEANGRPEQRVPMTRLRKRIAERLLSAKRDYAILTTFNEINMKPVTDLRNKYRDLFEKKHSIRLGFMSFFTKAAVVALQRFPVVNATIEGDDIIYHGYYDIGIAVSSPRGLVVPILRDVDSMSFAEIERNINILGKKAQDSQLTIEDLSGGTFSITNGGIFGSMMSTPILNPPQSAILGMHNIVERPVAENGQVVIRPVMYVALSYDHRLIDGRDAVQFLVAIKTLVEDPSRLLLEV